MWIFRRRLNQAVIIQEQIEVYLVSTSADSADFLFLGLENAEHKVIRMVPEQAWRIEKNGVVLEDRPADPLDGYQPYVREGTTIMMVVRNYHPDGVAVGFYKLRDCTIRPSERRIDDS